MFRRIAFTLIAVSLFATSAAFAQSSDTETANASARVLNPISITKLSDLDFGTLVSSPAAGTVVVTPGGVRTATGGASLLTSSFNAASFNVTGQASTAYTITLPTTIPITDGGVNSMTVNTFTSNPSGSGTLSGLGAQVLNVGATLNVAANQAAGLYTGTFNVTVAY